MTLRPRSAAWLAFAVAVAGIAALDARALTAGFLNDDYVFLEEAARRSPLAALLHPGTLANYFRPLSRQLWFALLTPLAGGHPLAWHAVHFALFALALALLLDLLLAATPPAAAFAGLLWFATLPWQRVNLTWISCSQDLLALAGSLAALALYRRRRDRWALVAAAAAVLAKETAWPLPFALAAWTRLADGAPRAQAVRRALPFAVVVALVAAGEWAMRAASPGPARLVFDVPGLAAAFAHLVQSLAGVEDPPGFARSLAEARPSVPALAILLALVPLVARRGGAAPAADAAPPPPARGTAAFGVVWTLAFALPVWPVAYGWSGYYYTLAAAGAALLVALVARRIGPWGLAALLAAFVWWNAAGSVATAFATREDPWVWTSHLTPGYFERGARLSSRLRDALRRVAPRPAPGTRFFFATLPPFAGFQMGNGAAIRHLYGDTSLASYYYSEYGERTADAHPCVFLFWDGVDFQRLYAHAQDPFFQVGTDLLLLDRPAGAIDAFRRGLAEGGQKPDLLYWLGFAYLWNGQRDAAERAWTALGARDDSLRREIFLHLARGALEDRDTLMARRELAEAIHAGMGRPEAHAVLGQLLQREFPKYALLETRVAATLDPADWLARRDLVQGLVAAHLDDQARAELAELRRILPGWRTDTVVTRLVATLDARDPAAGPVARFTAARSGGRR